MKIVRFQRGDVVVYGLLEGEAVRPVTGDIFGQWQAEDTTLPLSSVALLAPCVPSKAVCVGLNYHDHAREMHEALPESPLLFIKPPTTVIGPGAGIVYPDISHELHYEAELAVVIGRRAKHVTADQAHKYILGYTCANDVTARDIQRHDVQWTRGKSFDTFLPLGPAIVTDINVDDLGIQLFLNEQRRQNSNTRELIFKVPVLVEFITQVMTLEPGDVILTGTSSGVGPMQVGDTVTVAIDNIGRLTNHIVAP